MIVLIDNGHGASTPGKCSPDGSLREYRWARRMAAEITARLRRRGIDARRIVDTDTDVALRERVARVNRVCDTSGARNVLLVSIHVNAAGADGRWHDASGWSVFVSKNASVASRQFAAAMGRRAEASGIRLHAMMRPAMYCTWSWTDADIYLLRHSRCPAVLTENLFMDNRADCLQLLSDEGFAALAELHTQSIVEYAQSNHH